MRRFATILFALVLVACETASMRLAKLYDQRRIALKERHALEINGAEREGPIDGPLHASSAGVASALDACRGLVGAAWDKCQDGFLATFNKSLAELYVAADVEECSKEIKEKVKYDGTYEQYLQDVEGVVRASHNSRLESHKADVITRLRLKHREEALAFETEAAQAIAGLQMQEALMWQSVSQSLNQLNANMQQQKMLENQQRMLDEQQLENQRQELWRQRNYDLDRGH